MWGDMFTDLLHPCHQSFLRFWTFVIPSALDEALHLELLEDHEEVGVWAWRATTR